MIAALMLAALLTLAGCGTSGGGEAAPEPEEPAVEEMLAEEMPEEPGEPEALAEDGEAMEPVEPVEADIAEAAEGMEPEALEPVEPAMMEPEPEPEPPPVAMAEPPPPPMEETVTEGDVPEFGYLEYADEVPEPAQEPDDLAMLVPESAGPVGGRAIRVAVLHGESKEQSGIGVAIVIDIFRGEALQRDIGSKVQVVYISQMSESGPRANLIRYREGAMKAAMQIARHLPLNQIVEPMTPDEIRKQGVDLIVYIGAGMN